ncbi:unnamed protein product, partial [Effrenium voratum]
MAVLLGRRVPTPSSNLSQLAADEALDELPGLNQEQPHGLRSKQRRRPCAGLENVDPDAMSVKPSKLSAASPNKENEEGIFSKRKVLEKEVPELALVEALRTAPPGQRYAALCGLRKALAQPRPPIANVLRCGGAELLIAALRTDGSGASPGGRAEAAWCLVQLASGSSAQTRQLVEAGAASAAMDTLASCRDSSELCDCSLQLLANVAGDVDCSFRDGLLDAGVVNVLAQLFEKMPGFTWSGMERCAVLQSFTWLMATLCRGTPAPALEKVDSTFDFFSQVLHGTADKEMLSGALWGLCYLLEGASEICLGLCRVLFGERLPLDLLQEDEVETRFDFPSDCPEGRLTLAGRYVVSSSTIINSSCTLEGKAEIFVSEQLRFRRNVRITGRLEVTSHGLSEPCLRFRYLEVEAGAALAVRGCHSSSIFKPGAVEIDKNLTTAGEMSFRNCSSNMEGGGLAVRGTMHQEGGVVSFENCMATFTAGGLLVKQGLRQRGGLLRVRGCSAQHAGGAFISGGLDQQAGSMIFQECTAMLAAGGLMITEGQKGKVLDGVAVNGSMIFDGCASNGNTLGTGGGGAKVTWGRVVVTGTLSFRNSFSNSYGGGAELGAMRGGPGNAAMASIELVSGLMSFENCWGKGQGGGLAMQTGTYIVVSGGTLRMDNCSATSGGGLSMTSTMGFKQTGGELDISGCSARNEGGALCFVNTKVDVSGGQWNIKNCRANLGGGVNVRHIKDDVRLRDSNFTFSDCHAGEKGGGMYVEGMDVAVGGYFTFSNCSARRGGGLKIKEPRGYLRVLKGSLTFRNCSAAFGGGLDVWGLDQGHGKLSFSDCRAEIAGGGAWVHTGGWHQHFAYATFERCRSYETGGGLFTNGVTKLRRVVFEDCHADGSGAAILSRKATTVDSVEVISKYSDWSISTIAVLEAPLELGLANCSQIALCRFKAQTVKVSELECQRGAGHELLPDSTFCWPCPPGRVQVEQNAREACAICPATAERCQHDLIKMPKGQMLFFHNLSQTYFCPNAKACPGGDTDRKKPMCSKGYTGPGCSTCDAGYAKGDTSVVSCVKCADPEDTKAHALCIAFVLAKDIILFFVAVAGIRGAAHKKKHSAVLTNQLMSFSTVASSSVAAAMQTGIFHTMQSEFSIFLQTMGVLVDLGSGTSA